MKAGRGGNSAWSYRSLWRIFGAWTSSVPGSRSSTAGTPPTVFHRNPAGPTTFPLPMIRLRT